jgi:hypothetical protein
MQAASQKLQRDMMTKVDGMGPILAAAHARREQCGPMASNQSSII